MEKLLEKILPHVSGYNFYPYKGYYGDRDNGTREPGAPNADLVSAHLKGGGNDALAVIPFKDGKVGFCVFDIDCKLVSDPTGKVMPQREADRDERKERLCAFLDKANVPYTLMLSGSGLGYHIIITFKDPMPLAWTKAFGDHVANKVGLTIKDGVFEFFPKNADTNAKDTIALPGGRKSKLLSEIAPDFDAKAIEDKIKPAKPAKKTASIDFAEAFKCAARAHDQDTYDSWKTFAFVVAAARDFPQDLAKELWTDWSKNSNAYKEGDEDWWDKKGDKVKCPDWTFWNRAKRNGYTGKTPLQKGEQYDEDELDRLKETYKVVTHAGKTSVWRMGINADFHFPEWIELSPQDMKLENHMSKGVDAFLKDPSKPIYNNGFTFDPSRSDAPEGMINRWTGWDVPKPTPEEQARGWPTIERHMREVLFNDEINGAAGCYDYMIRKCAFYVQHPEQSEEVATIVRGMKGNGKSKFGELLRSFCPKHTMIISKPEHLVGRFNAHLVETVFQEVDEGALTDKKTEGVLKNLITTGVIASEDKGKKILMRRVATHMYITANEKWVVRSSDNERRFAVFDTGEKRDQSYYTALVNAIGDEKAGIIGNERSAFFDFLRNFALGEWHPRQGIPQTKALQEQRTNTEAFGIEGRLRDWLIAGVLPNTHPKFVAANELIKSRGVIALNGRFTSQQIGIALADYVVSRRVTLQVKSAVTGEVAGKRVHVWEFLPLAECRQKFDPNEAWDDTEDWQYEYTDNAEVPNVEDDEVPF